MAAFQRDGQFVVQWGLRQVKTELFYFFLICYSYFEISSNVSSSALRLLQLMHDVCAWQCGPGSRVLGVPGWGVQIQLLSALNPYRLLWPWWITPLNPSPPGYALNIKWSLESGYA